jgi:hypothetical protein
MPAPNKDEETKSRRELLAEAFDEAEQQDDEDSPRANTAASGEGVGDTPPDDQGVVGEGEAGGDGKEGKEGAVGETKEPKGKTRVSKPEETADQKERKAAALADKGGGERIVDSAPGSWKPGAREEWSKIPAASRAEITRRELEIQRELTQTAQVRRFSNDLANVVHPHLGLIQQQGTTPLAAIDSLMKTASRLFMGNPEQKARVIAEVMANYGVDVVMLDKVLSGQPLPANMRPGAPEANNAPPAWAQPIFGFMQTVQQQQQQRDQEMQQQSDMEIQNARGNLPFFEDLRLDIADILESAAKRGRVMTLAQAHERAAALDPEISQILSQRKAAAANKNNGGPLAQKRRAASSIQGGPRGGVVPNTGKQSRKDALRAAWDETA